MADKQLPAPDEVVFIEEEQTITKADIDKKKPKKSKFVVKTLDDPTILSHVDTWISTQCLPLDHALGGKGLPVRRVVEIYGDNSTGKSLVATNSVVETQRIGGVGSYADCEIAQYKERLQQLGVDAKKLLYDNPRTVDDVFNCLDEYIAWRNKNFATKVPLTFVWDSLSAITTMALLERADKEGDEGKNYPDVARAMSQILSQRINQFAEENVLFIVINQTREKLGLYTGGDGPATTGGKSLPFYASIRIELQTKGLIRDVNKDVIGAYAQATIVKNRLAAPFKRVLLPMYYNYGIDDAEATLEYMLAKAMIEHEKSSPWYTIKFGEEEVKFMRKGWTDIFIDRYDEVVKLFNNGGSNG